MQKTLVIFSGLPGTGKTTLAKKLARELKVTYLGIDDVVGELPESPTVQFWDSKVAILLGLAERQLELSLSMMSVGIHKNGVNDHAQTQFELSLCQPKKDSHL